MDIVADDGSSLVGTGEVGELVCRKPFPGMTRGFWGDPERYLETYWRRFPGIWTHGDWASADADDHPRAHDPAEVAHEAGDVSGVDVGLIAGLARNRDEEAALNVQRALRTARRA